MRYTLLIILCALNFTASAQFWKSKPKVEERPQVPELVLQINVIQPVTVSNTKLNTPPIHGFELAHTEFEREIAEEMMLNEAKHNMRFRIYNLASYNFSSLAAMYAQDNRFSEAKWYFLQSNELAHQANDTKHILDNLLALAAIKIQIGELTLAKTDLQEAHDIAAAKVMQNELTEINKRLIDLETNKIVSPKLGLRYADAVEAENNKVKIN